MPNWTETRINVVGRKECVEEFIKVLNADYDYYNYKFDHNFHVYRTWVDSYDIEHYGLIAQASIYLQCAWSVYLCMFKGPETYYNNHVGGYNRAVSIDELSKIYGLYIEIWSDEPLMEFQEHYYIINGKIIIDECFSSQFGGHILENFESYSEYINIYINSDFKLSEEEFNSIKQTNPYYYLDPPDFKEWHFNKNVFYAKPNNLCYNIMIKSVNK